MWFSTVKAAEIAINHGRWSGQPPGVIQRSAVSARIVGFFFILELAGWCAGCVQDVWIARIAMVWPGLPDISRGDLLSLLLAASSRGIRSDGQVGT